MIQKNNFYQSLSKKQLQKLCKSSTINKDNLIAKCKDSMSSINDTTLSLKL